jgi:uncharacterized membrane protein YdjX (TVP38/TMEM64 family)
MDLVPGASGTPATATCGVSLVFASTVCGWVTSLTAVVVAAIAPFDATRVALRTAGLTSRELHNILDIFPLLLTPFQKE